MKNKKGFTLVELIIVIAIISVISVVMIPIITGVMTKSNEQNDDVAASLYTSVMQQFANEKAGEALLYPSLTTTGEDAEYTVLSLKSGNGMFPGYNILEYDNEDDTYAAIRREAVIAIKAFSKAKTLDGYYVEPPTKEHYQYVYYYLTGEVKVEDERNKTPVGRESVRNGVINTDDFWVYLSRDGGSGEAVINSENGTGMVFVQIRQYGTDELLDETTVTINIGSEIRTAKTTGNGTVGFTDIPLGTVYISAEKLGAVSFPDSRFYDETGELVVKNGGYVGDSAANPYVITLKLGSLGSLGFYRRTNAWNGSNWVTTDRYITDNNVTFTSAFTPDTTRTLTYERAETYYTPVASTGGKQELLTTDGKFLLYGSYKLRVSSTGFRDYNEDIVSRVYGIDNYSNGGTGQYANATAPYEYPIVMRRPQGTGQVTGSITWERAEQPLQGYPNESGSWLAGYENSSVKTRVVMKNKSTGTKYYSEYFTASSTGKYPYSINSLPDGKYTIYLETPYGDDSLLTLTELPDEIVIDGAEVTVNAQVYYADVGLGNADITVTYDSKGNNDPISGASVVLKRMNHLTYSTLTTDDDGKCSRDDIKRGFYFVTVTPPDYIGNSSYTYKIFVDGDEDIVIRLPIDTITVNGTISGLKPDGTAVGVNGSFDGLKVTLTRYNKSGSKNYSAVKATTVTTGQDATYTVNLVPGMYKISTSVTCYKAYSGANTLRNFKSNTTFSFSLSIDGDTITCHPSAKVSWKQDASYHWRQCSKCNTIFGKTAHVYSKWTDTGENGCYRYCTEPNCNRTLNQVTAHDYQYKSSGSYAATCVANGNKHYECSRCGRGKNESIPKSGHNYGSWTSNDSSTHSRTCKNCGDKQTQNHSFNSWYWTSTTPSMASDGRCCYYNGNQRRDCLTCGYYETNAPMVGHAIECYMMRYYVNDTTYYNMSTSYTTAYFKTAEGRMYCRLAGSDSYDGRQVFLPGSPSAGKYGMNYVVTGISSTFFSQSAIFSNTKHSHLIACKNRPVINGTTYYCHAPINHNGDPLGPSCGCNNKPLGYVLNSSGNEIKPKLNPSWSSPYAKFGR